MEVSVRLNSCNLLLNSSKYVVYQALFNEKERIRIVTSKEQFEGLRILVMPRKIIYEPELEEALIGFVKNGGKLIATADFFRKNTENVYLTRVPEIYKLLFGSNCNDFFHEEIEEKKPVVRECILGSGKAFIISEDADLDDWKMIKEKLFYT